MGKHSAPESTPFLRSIVAWALPWMLIVAVVAVALLVAIRMVDDDPVQASGPASDAATSAPETQPDPEPSKKDDKEDAAANAEKDEQNGQDTETERDPTKEPESELITDGVSIQVLNGTSDAAADDVAADRLARLGYEVVAVSPAARAYPRTVVFWVGARKDAARALADRFEWDAQPAPSNLSTEVDLHVVVGNDAA